LVDVGFGDVKKSVDNFAFGIGKGGRKDIKLRPYIDIMIII
jgi:hypothetical protein